MVTITPEPHFTQNSDISWKLLGSVISVFSSYRQHFDTICKLMRNSFFKEPILSGDTQTKHSEYCDYTAHPN